MITSTASRTREPRRAQLTMEVELLILLELHVLLFRHVHELHVGVQAS